MSFLNNEGLSYLWNKIKTVFISRNDLPLPVSYGGTQATTAASARTNLGIDEISSATIDSIINTNSLDSSNLTTSWGNITGTLSNQTDLNAILSNKINASDFAIIVDGDTCAIAVPVYGYAYIKNNTHGLVEGLYQNTSNDIFPMTGGTADGSIFTGVSNILNNKNVDYVLLAEGLASATNTIITLSDSITNYKYLYTCLLGQSATYGTHLLDMATIPVSILKANDVGGFAANGYTTARTYVYFSYVSDTQFFIQVSNDWRIYGIR